MNAKLIINECDYNECQYVAFYVSPKLCEPLDQLENDGLGQDENSYPIVVIYYKKSDWDGLSTKDFDKVRSNIDHEYGIHENEIRVVYLSDVQDSSSFIKVEDFNKMVKEFDEISDEVSSYDFYDEKKITTTASASDISSLIYSQMYLEGTTISTTTPYGFTTTPYGFTLH